MRTIAAVFALLVACGGGKSGDGDGGGDGDNDAGGQIDAAVDAPAAGLIGRCGDPVPEGAVRANVPPTYGGT